MTDSAAVCDECSSASGLLSVGMQKVRSAQPALRGPYQTGTAKVAACSMA